MRRVLRRVCVSSGGRPCPQAGNPQLRAGRGRPHLRVRRPAGAAGQRGGPTGAAGADHRRVRRGGVVRGATGQGVRRRRDRGVQHDPARPGPIHRRRPRHRLHPRRPRGRDTPLGPHPRHRRPPFAVPAAARPHPPRNAGHRRRRGGGTVAGRLRSQPSGASAVPVRQPAAADAGLQAGPGRPANGTYTTPRDATVLRHPSRLRRRIPPGRKVRPPRPRACCPRRSATPCPAWRAASEGPYDPSRPVTGARGRLRRGL